MSGGGHEPAAILGAVPRSNNSASAPPVCMASLGEDVVPVGVALVALPAAVGDAEVVADRFLEP
jgi:hypothetical protein